MAKSSYSIAKEIMKVKNGYQDKKFPSWPKPPVMSDYFTTFPVAPPVGYSFAPCPTCGQTPTGYKAESEYNGITNSVVTPCGHQVVNTTINQMNAWGSGIINPAHFYISYDAPPPQVPPQFGGKPPLNGEVAITWNSPSSAYYTYIFQNEKWIQTTPSQPPQLMSTMSWSGGMVCDELAKLFPAINTYFTWCPECGPTGAKATIVQIIPHVNDQHQYTRERIADWLETLPVDLSVIPSTKGSKNGIDSTRPEIEATPADYYEYGTVTISGGTISKG